MVKILGNVGQNMTTPPLMLMASRRPCKSRTSCYHLVTRLMTVTDLLQVVPLRLFVTSCYELVVINLLRSDDISLVGTTCCQSFVWPHQPCYKMITTCSKLVNNWEQAVRTHLVDKLRDFHPCTTHVKTHKLLQICS